MSPPGGNETAMMAPDWGVHSDASCCLSICASVINNPRRFLYASRTATPGSCQRPPHSDSGEPDRKLSPALRPPVHRCHRSPGETGYRRPPRNGRRRISRRRRRPIALCRSRVVESTPQSLYHVRVIEAVTSDHRDDDRAAIHHSDRTSPIPTPPE